MKMKAVMITLDQAHYFDVIERMSRLNIKGFSSWRSVYGRGSNTGEPHFGTHAWPSMNNAIMTIVEEERVQPLLDALKELDKSAENLGLRAFVWNIENMI